MSDKTLVERLRELQNRDCACITQCDFVNAVGAKCCREMQGYGCNLCFNVTVKAIADAIEREYLPLPRFEDGEPVQFGDAYTDKHGRKWENGIKAVHIDCNGEFSLHSCARGGSGMFEEFEPNERVKRPEPEVLDADGVLILVGDTVYDIRTGEEFKVEEITSGDNFCVFVTEGLHLAPFVLTHKEPDSLKHIEDDAKENVCVYFDKQGSTKCNGCDKSLHPYIECHREMMLDLMKRQREVLERNHER